MRYCSLPEFGNIRKWFEKNFSNPCEHHDKLYAEARVSRFTADVMLVSHMIGAVRNKDSKSRIFIYYPIIAITFITVRLFGFTHYKNT